MSTSLSRRLAAAADVAYLSGDFAVLIAAIIEERCSKCADERTLQDAENSYIEDLFLLSPVAVKDAMGLTDSEARGLYLLLNDAGSDGITPFGHRQAGDLKLGESIMRKPSPCPWSSTWSMWRGMRETGPNGRAEMLRRAQARLARCS